MARSVRLPRLVGVKLNTALVEGSHDRSEIGVTCQKNTARIGKLACFAEKHVACHVRHTLVRDDHRDIGRFFQIRQRFERVGAGEDIELVFKQVGQGNENFCLIVNKQDTATTVRNRHFGSSHALRPIVTGPVGVKRTGTESVKHAPTP